ncbi:unnamed protein product [Protopolystoma xenopodis]|uniref:Uncharacterized protein n=1 Tax=Protopolystoma xenopodis TaxID=117903 RepID=A0A3S5FH52_9PLAT|nr:unnamed protein product [Protopolystoma xenopodis]
MDLCGLITLVIYPDLSLSIGSSELGLQSGSHHCLVDRFLIFLVNRFHSVPVPVCFSLQELFLNAIEARTQPPRRAYRLGSDCHACRYHAFPSRVLSFIKPMLSEQTLDAYLLSHLASRAGFWGILVITPNFRDSLLIRLPSSLTTSPPKLYWFIRNGHHSLTTSSLDWKKPLPPIFLIAIPFSPVSGRSLIQASPFCWSCSILVVPKFA